MPETLRLQLLSRLLSLANPDTGTRRTKALITKISLPTIHSCQRDSWRISATPTTTAPGYAPRNISVVYAKMIMRQSSEQSASDSVLLDQTQLFLILQPYRMITRPAVGDFCGSYEPVIQVQDLEITSLSTRLSAPDHNIGRLG